MEGAFHGGLFARWYITRLPDLQDSTTILDDHHTGRAPGLLQSATDRRDGGRYMRHLWLIFGWSALLIILLIPMSDSPRFVALVSLLELPSIGWQLFILDRSQSDPKALPAFLDTYATRLLTEPLSYLVCSIRCIYVTEVAKAANGMISTV